MGVYTFINEELYENKFPLYIKSSTSSTDKLKIEQVLKFDVKQLVDLSYENYEYVGETIEKIASKLIYKYKFDIMRRNFYAYIMRELMRNVVEHSKADEFFLSIYRRDNKEIGFKVLDYGIGIKKSINSHPNYNVKDHMTALAFSIRPGITKTYKKDPSIDDIWQNSGFGLYMVSSIANEIGCFSIASGDSELISKSHTNSYSKKKIKGTEVTVVLQNNISVNTSVLLREISQRGNEFAKNSPMFSKYAEIKTASKASTLLNN